MSRWVVEDETEKLYLSDGEWVEIRKRLSAADHDTLTDRLFEIEYGEHNQSEPEVNARYKPSTVALLTLAITDWSFHWSSGQKVQVTPKNIGRLDPELALWLEAEIGRRNPLGRRQNSQQPTTNSAEADQPQSTGIQSDS